MAPPIHIPIPLHPQARTRPGQGQIWVVTGTDTGVGKTVLAAVLTSAVHQAGATVVALKPVCSGGRDDARLLHAAAHRPLTLDEVNPWHFPKPLAPALAARQARRRLTLAQVAGFVHAVAARFPMVIIEGAGGLLSPLGVDFDTRDLIRCLHAVPWVVCPNRLGAVNQALLVVNALGSPHDSSPGTVVLMDQASSDASAAENAALIRHGLRRIKQRGSRPPPPASKQPAGRTRSANAWRVLPFPWLDPAWRQSMQAGGIPAAAHSAAARLLRGLPFTRMAFPAGRRRIP